jgi:hypothetical protein
MLPHAHLAIWAVRRLARCSSVRVWRMWAMAVPESGRLAIIGLLMRVCCAARISKPEALDLPTMARTIRVLVPTRSAKRLAFSRTG